MDLSWSPVVAGPDDAVSMCPLPFVDQSAFCFFTSLIVWPCGNTMVEVSLDFDARPFFASGYVREERLVIR